METTTEMTAATETETETTETMTMTEMMKAATETIMPATTRW